MKLAKKEIGTLIFVAIFFFVVIIILFVSNGDKEEQNNEAEKVDSVDNIFRLEIVDKMALSYIQSRQSDTKWTDENQEYYFIYLNITVENLTDEIISFGASMSDYYAKLDIGRPVNQPVYFQENRHLNDRIPYWTKIGYDDPNWDNIVFFYANSSLTEIAPHAKRTFYLAFQSHKTYQNADLKLVIYESAFLTDPEVKTIDVGRIPISE